MATKSNDDNLIPSFAVAGTAFFCAAILAAVAVLGPAFLNVIHYHTSQSVIWQTQAFDITDLIVIVPLLVIGGVFTLLKKQSSKYFLVLTPIVLLYLGVEYGIGQEWGNPTYTGNSEAFSGLFLAMTIGGLILLLASLPRFTPKDAPGFKTKWLRVYVAVMAVFLLMFAYMWSSQLLQVITSGNTTAGDYLSAPTGWWMVKFMDLGVTIPLGFIALLLLLSKPQRAYPLVLLFFGFFITLGTAVNASAIIEVINKDPTVTTGTGAAGLVIFPVLALLAYGGLFYLVKDKLRGQKSTAQ